MQVVHDGQLGGIDFVHRQQIVNGQLEGRIGLAIAQVADVLADDHLAADHQRDRVLQVGAQRQNGPVAGKPANGAGRKASRAANHQWLLLSHGHDRIVDPPCNRALADQQCVGDARQALAGVVVAVGNRFAGTIGAGQHQRTGCAGREQQMMQRRIGQHDAQRGVVGRNARQIDLGRRQHDRPGDVEQQLFVRRRQMHQLAGLCDVLRQQGERFFLAIFSRAQRLDRRGRARVASQVIPADALDRDNSAGPQQFRSAADGGLAGRDRQLPMYRIDSPAHSRGKPRAGHDNGGRADLRIRAGRPGTRPRRASSCSPDRRASARRSNSADRSSCN